MPVRPNNGVPVDVSTRRRRYVVLALVTIAVGLIVHFNGRWLPPAFRDILGDALWAMMILWWMGVVAPRWSLGMRTVAAMTLCVAVELSQRYHAPMLDAIRRTVPGHLILGSGYDPRDVLSYAAGISVAAIVARAMVE